ncbi:MAG: hypothetical protein AB1898_13400 [Acidobacteriota bacterium]
MLTAMFVVLGQTAFAQLTNWSELFRELANPDPVVRKGGEQKLDQLLPKLQTLRPNDLQTEVVSMLDGLRDIDEAVRFKTAALLTTIAMIRGDATEALKPAVPLLIPQLQSEFKQGTKRLKENALWVIVSIRPEIPGEALEALLDLARGEDGKMAAIAVSGVGWFARTSPRALNELIDLMGPEHAVQIRSAAVRSLEDTGLAEPVVLMRLREILEGNGTKPQAPADDRELVRQTLRLVALLGPAAALLRPQVEQIAVEHKHLAQEARSTLLRLGK